MWGVHLLFKLRASQDVGGHLKDIFVPYMVKMGCFLSFLLKVSNKRGVYPLYRHRMCAKMLNNGMVEINWKSTILMIRLYEVHGLIQDLLYSLKATTWTSDLKIIHEISFDVENLYLAALTRIIIKLMDKEMHVEHSEPRERCRNNKPNQLSH